MKMNIVYTSSNDYSKYAGISLISLFESNKHIEELCIFYICDGVTKENKDKLKLISDIYNRQIEFIEFNDICHDLVTDGKFAVATYAKLFLGRITMLDKALYIDCDTIINGDLKDLWETDISKKMIGGILDAPAVYNREVIGLSHKDIYINAGVMLINLKKWREFELDSKAIEYISRYSGSVSNVDQGVFNYLCRDQILVLDPKYNMTPPMFMFNVKRIKKLYKIENYYSQKKIDEATTSPIIIHYISKFYNKPWNIDCDHPNKDLFIHYYKKSPWDFELSNNKLDVRVRIRKYIFTHFHFKIFTIIESLLDIKRSRYVFKHYKSNK